MFFVPRRFIFVATSVLGLLICFEAGCSRVSEISNAFYPALEAARAVDKGWIPGFLPATSRNIRETHNVDTNAVWIDFEFAADEKMDWLTTFQKQTGDDRNGILGTLKRIHPEFPGSLESLDCYKVANDKVPSFLVIDWQRHIARYWTP